MTREQKTQIDKAVRSLARRIREGNDAVGRPLDAEQYRVLEDELRRLLERHVR